MKTTCPVKKEFDQLSKDIARKPDDCEELSELNEEVGGDIQSGTVPCHSESIPLPTGLYKNACYTEVVSHNIWCQDAASTSSTTKDPSICSKRVSYKCHVCQNIIGFLCRFMDLAKAELRKSLLTCTSEKIPNFESNYV